MENKQIKSKKRVADHGEVFTNEREVKAMCDLVKNECDRIESKFLEPACGNGNFLQEILNRKLKIVNKIYRKSQYEWELNALKAISSLYGIELLSDNAIECRKRLYDNFEKQYRHNFENIDKNYLTSILYIIHMNIVNGNALTYCQVSNNVEQTNSPIIFSEWTFVKKEFIKQKRYMFKDILNKSEKNNYSDIVGTLFDEDTQIEYLNSIKPIVVADFPIVHFKKMWEVCNG
ncbi:MAG: hypothetical protein LBM76_02200 [Mycoplasmataceae bacterium]|nr:hypothetical protein [Mycoplasmataceae bacterium]